MGKGLSLLVSVEWGIGEASGPHCEAEPGLSGSEMPLGAQQLPPLWGLPGAKSGEREEDSHHPYAHHTPKD